jgi:hypothetical protein
MRPIFLPRRAIAALVSVLALAGCEKNGVQDITGSLPGSRVRFFNFGINAPQVNFYANDAKVTAISSTTGAESTIGVAYGAVASSGFYSAVEPGQYTLSGRIAATVDKDLPVARATATLAADKAYSFYMSGFYDAAAKTVEAFVVEDNFPAAFDFTQAYVRFVNASPNSSPMQLFARNTTSLTETSIGAAVPYRNGGAFVAVPAAVYDLATRTAGSTTNAIARTAVSFVAGRTYTISARGDMTITSTTAVNRPFLDNTANR